MSYTNWKQCKAYMLDYAQGRAHKFTRVSKGVQAQLDAVLIAAMRRIVDCQPSKGKTIK